MTATLPANLLVVVNLLYCINRCEHIDRDSDRIDVGEG